METPRQTGSTTPDNGRVDVPPDRMLPRGKTLSPLEEIEAGRPFDEVAMEWVEQNRGAAMAGAFAVGTLLGIMLRR